MSEKGLKQLVGALAVAVTVWLVMAVFRGGSGSGSIAASGEIAGFFDGIDAATVQSVRMTRGESSVMLEASDGGWTANGFSADETVVTRLLELVDETEIGELVAANPDNHPRMGVSSDSAVAVTFATAEGERTLLVGKSTQRFGTAYARLPDADEVYLLDGDLRPHLTRGLDEWRDRTMVAIDTAAVARIVVEQGGDTYALVRGDSAWTFDGGGAVAVSAVEAVLWELSDMVATGFLTEADSLANQPLATTTSALSASGEVLAEITVGAGEGDRWARTASAPYVYRLSSFRAGRIAPSRDEATSGS